MLSRGIGFRFLQSSSVDTGVHSHLDNGTTPASIN